VIGLSVLLAIVILLNWTASIPSGCDGIQTGMERGEQRGWCQIFHIPASIGSVSGAGNTTHGSRVIVKSSLYEGASRLRPEYHHGMVDRSSAPTEEASRPRPEYHPRQWRIVQVRPTEGGVSPASPNTTHGSG